MEAEASGGGLDPGLVESTLPLVPGIIERLQAGVDVADIGCGSGRHLNLIARAFPASRFVGLDFFDPALAAARAEASHLGPANVSFVKRDAASLNGSQTFDFITTFDAVHDQARPDLVLAGIVGSLRPGGTYLLRVSFSDWHSVAG